MLKFESYESIMKRNKSFPEEIADALNTRAKNLLNSHPSVIVGKQKRISEGLFRVAEAVRTIHVPSAVELETCNPVCNGFGDAGQLRKTSRLAPSPPFIPVPPAVELETCNPVCNGFGDAVKLRKTNRLARTPPFIHVPSAVELKTCNPVCNGFGDAGQLRKTSRLASSPPFQDIPLTVYGDFGQNDITDEINDGFITPPRISGGSAFIHTRLAFDQNEADNLIRARRLDRRRKYSRFIPQQLQNQHQCSSSSRRQNPPKCILSRKRREALRNYIEAKLENVSKSKSHLNLGKGIRAAVNEESLAAFRKRIRHAFSSARKTAKEMYNSIKLAFVTLAM